MENKYEELELEIDELKAMLLEDDEWDDIPESDFSFNLDPNHIFTFEIRTKEKNHNIPHFHVKKSDNSGSYVIVSLEKLCGNFSSKDEKIIIEWGNKNKTKLISTWNKLHSDKKILIGE